jgi:hypothetical protein
MGQFDGSGLSRDTLKEFERRKVEECVKTSFDVRAKYRLREDTGLGYLELAFEPDAVDKLKRIFGLGSEDSIFGSIRMLPRGLLYFKSDPTGKIGYKLTSGNVLQISTLQTANIPEPPADDAHRAGVEMDLMMTWTLDMAAFNINIPPSLFRYEDRNGNGAKLRAPRPKDRK